MIYVRHDGRPSSASTSDRPLSRAHRAPSRARSPRSGAPTGRIRRGACALALALAAAVATGPAALAVPAAIPYIGQLTFEAGSPYQGTVQIRVWLYAAETGGTPVWGPQEHTSVAVQDGLLSFTIGGAGVTGLEDALRTSGPLWLELEVAGVVMTGRQRVLAVPYARVAADAERLGGVEAGAFALASGLSAVATSGSYVDLSGAPDLSGFAPIQDPELEGTVAVSGSVQATSHVQVGAQPASCSPTLAGAIRFEAGQFEGCNGAEWVRLDGVAPPDEGEPTPPPSGGPHTFVATGSAQTWVVPSGVTTIQVDVRGAQGGRAFGTSVGWSGGPVDQPGGLGGRVQATLPVTPGETLHLYVGRSGDNGGWNGGGQKASCSGTEVLAGHGGGASDIRRGGAALGDRVVVAGGGGGAAGASSSYVSPGGAGGGLTGADANHTSSHCVLGLGGTQSSGGAGGNKSCWCGSGASGQSGGLGLGGGAACSSSGLSTCSCDGTGCVSGGGGGGGYYGGGAGTAWGGGGGGSSWTSALASAVNHTQGHHSGDGQIVISY